MGRSSSKNTRPTAAEAPQGKGTLAVLDAAIGDYLLPTAGHLEKPPHPSRRAAQC